MTKINPHIQRYISPFCISLFAIAASLGAFNGGLWAALGIGGATVLTIAVSLSDKKWVSPSRNFLFLMLATLLIFVAELPLSSRPDISLKTWLQLVTIFMPLLLLTTARVQAAIDDQSFIKIVTLAAGLGALALGIELQSGGILLHIVRKPDASLTEYNRGMAHLAILAFPLLAGLWASKRKYATYALTILLLFPAELTESHTAKLALVLGAMCVLAASYQVLWVYRGLTALSVILMGWPFYARWMFSTHYDVVENMHPSWRHRMEIWDYLSYRIAERPLMGWGLGTTHTLDFIQPHGNLYQNATQMAPHAHNFITEIWVEAGLPGLALSLIFLLLTLRKAYTLDISLRPFALGGWTGALVVSLFGFDFWTDALWASFALSAFAFGVLQQSIERTHNRINA